MEGGEVRMNMLSLVSGLPPSQPDSFMVNEVFFRPDDPALLCPGRLDHKVEFGLPDLERADIRSVCTEAGMYAIWAWRKTVTEKDFLDAVNKVIKVYQKFSATPKYMVYN
ncbi:hypothetical protein RHMOL_Rhmol12G0249300 [Rhododendron molle]|uniref:Uncharacterized protein n=1 Tax=Rhododendron molle TaxID=49168 RepID=A0ACC0LMD7_RHOML|nr:hypothetical protein RHMOL_Rhmol12G0249300 [Rhododendron molle]